MTTNIGASILQINSFNLESTSLSLIRLDFENLALVVMVERYEVWVILGHVYGLFARFHTVDSVLDDM